MYPRRELKYLAHIRMRRIRSIDKSRRESCHIVSRVASPLRLIDWAMVEWRATQLPARLAMLPVGHFLSRPGHASSKSVHRILQGALFVFAIARKLDGMTAGHPARLDQD